MENKETINKKLNTLIDYLYLNNDTGFYYTAEGMVTKTELKDSIKKLMGIDKQCFKCLDYKFDMKVVEGTDKFVCEDCTEKILKGNIIVLPKELE